MTALSAIKGEVFIFSVVRPDSKFPKRWYFYRQVSVQWIHTPSTPTPHHWVLKLTERLLCRPTHCPQMPAGLIQANRKRFYYSHFHSNPDHPKMSINPGKNRPPALKTHPAVHIKYFRTNPPPPITPQDREVVTIWISSWPGSKFSLGIFQNFELNFYRHVRFSNHVQAYKLNFYHHIQWIHTSSDPPITQ